MSKLHGLLGAIRALLPRFRLTRGQRAASSYRAYTRRFDRVVSAEELIEEYRPALINGKTVQGVYDEFLELTHSWRMQADIAALEAGARVRRCIDENKLKDTVVTLLVDHSGSMRDQKLLLAMAAVSVATDLLLNLGVKVEILGFTTSTWKGGTSRRAWQAWGKPPHPGRLCDLLHIIYREADSAIPGAPRNLCAMQLPGLLKENVDGEAIQWALERLCMRPESRKNLIVFSDGAPVDDSTLLENGDGYLWEHLISVLSEESDVGNIPISGLGICYASQAPYRISAEISSPDDLRGALIDLLEEVLDGSNLGPDRPTTSYH
jgi:cobaltochelatase CobT